MNQLQSLKALETNHYQIQRKKKLRENQKKNQTFNWIKLQVKLTSLSLIILKSKEPSKLSKEEPRKHGRQNTKLKLLELLLKLKPKSKEISLLEKVFILTSGTNQLDHLLKLSQEAKLISLSKEILRSPELSPPRKPDPKKHGKQHTKLLPLKSPIKLKPRNGPTGEEDNRFNTITGTYSRVKSDY